MNHIRYTVPETDKPSRQNVPKLPMPIIRYNMRADAILIFDKCLYLRGRLRLLQDGFQPRCSWER